MDKLSLNYVKSLVQSATSHRGKACATFLGALMCSEAFYPFSQIFVIFGHFSPGIPLLQGPFVARFLSLLGNFCHVLLLFKAPNVGPSGPPAGIRERSERDLT